MQKVLLLVLLSLVLLQAKDTYLQVYSSNTKLNVKVSLANFGYFKYGHKLTGRLHIGAKYTEWDETVDKDRVPRGSNEDNKNQTAIDFDILDRTKYDTSGCKTYQQFNDPYIKEYGQPVFLIDRGNCTFVRKASQAARYGKMLIIVDSSDQEDVNDIVMGDDLSGEKVMIPVVLVSKKDGSKIKELIRNELNDNTNNQSKQVWISITFNKPFEKEKSEIQYWMVPSERDSYTFLKNHTQFINTLVKQNYTVFEPHFVVFRCDEICKKGQQGTDMIANSCILDGQYCHPDPDGRGPLTGIDSLNQAITEMCIQDIFPEYFLTYFSGFHECYIKHSKKFIDCGKQAFEYVNEKHPEADSLSFTFKVQTCSQKEHQAPRLIEQEYKLFVDQGLKFYPSLFVNGDVYRGDLQIQEGAEEFICESLENSKNIDVCEPYNDIQDDDDSKFSGKFLTSEDSNLIIIVCAVLFFVFLIGLFIYRRKIKMEVQKELTMQVDAAIQQYYALNEGK